jgi:hypothetical protein
MDEDNLNEQMDEDQDDLLDEIFKSPIKRK